MPTATATRTPTLTPTLGPATATFTPTPTASVVPTATPTAIESSCTGDCDGNGLVTLDELVLGVSLVIDHPQANPCPRLDADRSGQVTVAELIQAVRNALTECP